MYFLFFSLCLLFNSRISFFFENIFLLKIYFSLLEFQVLWLFSHYILVIFFAQFLLVTFFYKLLTF